MHKVEGTSKDLRKPLLSYDEMIMMMTTGEKLDLERAVSDAIWSVVSLNSTLRALLYSISGDDDGSKTKDVYGGVVVVDDVNDTYDFLKRK